MNTEQKAREWLLDCPCDSRDEVAAFDIITALLAEREALLEALRPVGWHGVISATIINNAMKAITLCEKEHE